jgi:hypothetical protein
VWDRLNERRHELIHLKRQQGFLEERDEMDFNALQWVAGLVRELVAGQPFQVNDNSTTTTPRATAFRPMCDDPECLVCKRMAELHAENAPSVTGETTVEAAKIADDVYEFYHNKSLEFPVNSHSYEEFTARAIGAKEVWQRLRDAARTEGEGSI